jgi:hypothetical protein
MLAPTVGDEKVGEGRTMTQPGTLSLVGEGLDVGRDPASPVTADHPGRSPHAFTGGTIREVVVDVSGDRYVDVEMEALAMMKREEPHAPSRDRPRPVRVDHAAPRAGRAGATRRRAERGRRLRAHARERVALRARRQGPPPPAPPAGGDVRGPLRDALDVRRRAARAPHAGRRPHPRRAGHAAPVGESRCATCWSTPTAARPRARATRSSTPRRSPPPGVSWACEQGSPGRRAGAPGPARRRVGP